MFGFDVRVGGGLLADGSTSGCFKGQTSGTYVQRMLMVERC
ncbi:hypothetical protein ABT033_03390 [Streptomyces pharetrae]